ncbi:ABC transporter ATP-binding protein [Colwellia sp. E2M01]|uniref:ABC transporter ATP-binding protein n=1 Tax=Colwellia sp. E2M01 TaxID=2841561 RepID=UPI001C08A7AD|nr:ABC transporter ATP-binding protein [Colwellia sp. E2M01]MBU2869445.1 ABC transporter ATP-binding protein [Colwellia sp. E2M01]
MSNIICVKNVNKKYKDKKVLNDINFTVKSGEVIGLIGTNGAGKTTLLKSLLGLTAYKGDIEVCGLNPDKKNVELMKKVAFIADTATLPPWITCNQLLEYIAQMHEGFDIELAKSFISSTNIPGKMKVSSMSKGMVTQLHLSIVMSIKSQLLILDEPTLGLDIIRRKAFYKSLLTEYYDENNTIIVTTHQLEEIEHILTRVMFIDNGKIIADIDLDTLEKRFVRVQASSEHHDDLLALSPSYITEKIMGKEYLFENETQENLAQYGKVSTPELSDLFIALCQSSQEVVQSDIKEVTHA